MGWALSRKLIIGLAGSLIAFGFTAAPSSGAKSVEYQVKIFALEVKEVTHQDHPGGGTWDGEATELHELTKTRKKPVIKLGRKQAEVLVATDVFHTGFEAFRNSDGSAHSCSGLHRAESTSVGDGIPVRIKAAKKGTLSTWGISVSTVGTIAARNSCPFYPPFEWVTADHYLYAPEDNAGKVGNKSIRLETGGTTTRTASAFGFQTTQRLEWQGVMLLKRI